MTRRRPLSEENAVEEHLLEYLIDTRRKEQHTIRQNCCRCCTITGIITLVLAFLVLLLLFVVLPITFMLSIDMQRNLLFQRWHNNDYNEFTNFRRYSIEGVRNFYVPVSNNQAVQLGTWHILPLALVYEAVENDAFSYERALFVGEYPVVLYLHGTDGNRINNINMYRVLRRFFHVIAFDYRDYGDSSEAALSEDAMVQDCVQIYKWLLTQTRAQIYVWGHSLGASLSTHAIARLQKEGFAPMGLFLESPFNNIVEKLEYFPITRIFSWLPWFKATVLKPLEANDFIFNTTEHMKSVDCPVMMVHAEDDTVVPIFLAEKLYNSVAKTRDAGIQGNVTLHKLPGRFGYGHDRIYEAPDLPDFIKAHIQMCEAFDRENG